MDEVTWRLTIQREDVTIYLEETGCEDGTWMYLPPEGVHRKLL
jgi:hypothetical protein